MIGENFSAAADKNVAFDEPCLGGCVVINVPSAKPVAHRPPTIARLYPHPAARSHPPRHRRRKSSRSSTAAHNVACWRSGLRINWFRPPRAQTGGSTRPRQLPPAYSIWFCPGMSQGGARAACVISDHGADDGDKLMVLCVLARELGSLGIKAGCLRKQFYMKYLQRNLRRHLFVSVSAF